MIYGNIVGVMPKNISAFTNDADYLVKSEIITKNNTITSTNADYAEVGKWADGNPDNEDRIGYFVAIDNSSPGTTMVKATSTMDIRGVTVTAPAFSGGVTQDKLDSEGNLLPQYGYVAVMGLVVVIDNGKCEINGRCMPNDEGIAVPNTNNLGYQVIDRIDSTHILIAVEPSADMIQRIKTDMESKADLDSSGKVPESQLPSSAISSLTLGETENTAYRGDYGKIAYDHSQSEHVSLDEKGKIPSSYLPSYVDDVVEGYYYDGKFYKTRKESPDSTEESVIYVYSNEITSESDKIYIDVTTNMTYRWSGTIYVKITSDIALGETSSTAYRGDYGKIAYEHTLSSAGTNPHNTTKKDVGLGNVGNFKAVSTAANQGLSDEEKTNARANIGAGASSFSGSYNDLTDVPDEFTPSKHSHTASEVGAAPSSHIEDTNIHITSSERTKWNGKQDAITGTAGQVVGFDSNGKPIAQAAPSSVTDEEKEIWNGKADTSYVDSAIQTAIGNAIGGSY